MDSGQLQNLTETSAANQSSTSTESILDDQYSSSLGEIDCYLKALNVSYQFEKGFNRFCNITWDKVSCWPVTRANEAAVIPCFSELNGVNYDSTQNASRMCLNNGTWAEKSDYSKCTPITAGEELLNDIWNAKNASMIYYFGYGISLIALTIALWIFLYFKDLRCIRNTIHANLMITYELFALTWIITATLQLNPSSTKVTSQMLCCLYILLPYFTGTNFFWMFVEGLYLYILVVKTFSIELIKVYIYAFIGWGLPGIVVVVWAPLKYYFAKSSEYFPETGYNCPWQDKDMIDNIFIAPILFVLMLNIFFLCMIMWVLITKLRAATTAESRQYRKAAKALLVLTPLLGVAYILLLVTPNSGPAKTIFTYLQAILYSTQGFTVAVLYCFLNGEVRNSVRHHLQRWKTLRSFKGKDSSTKSRKGFNGSSTRLSEKTNFYKFCSSQEQGPLIDTSSANVISSSEGPSRTASTVRSNRLLSNGSSIDFVKNNSNQFEDSL